MACNVFFSLILFTRAGDDWGAGLVSRAFVIPPPNNGVQNERHYRLLKVKVVLNIDKIENFVEQKVRSVSCL